jgi:hypothetical protein
MSDMASPDSWADISRATAARLVLSDHAARVADAAAWLVTTRTDDDTAAGGRVSQALQVLEYGQRLLATAVIYERERGTTWSEIARYLGTTVETAQTEFEPHLTRWSAVFEDSDEAAAAATQRVSHSFRAVKDPRWIGDNLDFWAQRHLDDRDRHQVTDSLREHQLRISETE